MRLLQRMIEQVRGDCHERIVAEAVRRCATEVVRELSVEIHAMPAAERTGYVRARSRTIVARDARRHEHLGGLAETVLEGVVARILADLSMAPRMPLRRAA
jgi:hypothetical protein